MTYFTQTSIHCRVGRLRWTVLTHLALWTNPNQHSQGLNVKLGIGKKYQHHPKNQYTHYCNVLWQCKTKWLHVNSSKLLTNNCLKVSSHKGESFLQRIHAHKMYKQTLYQSHNGQTWYSITNNKYMPRVFKGIVWIK